MNYKNILLLTTLFSGALLTTSCGGEKANNADQKPNKSATINSLTNTIDHEANLAFFILKNKKAIDGELTTILKKLPQRVYLKRGGVKTWSINPARNSVEKNDLYRIRRTVERLRKSLRNSTKNISSLDVSSTNLHHLQFIETEKGEEIAECIRSVFSEGDQEGRFIILKRIHTLVAELEQIRLDNRAAKNAEK